jgi:uncharacterized phiE125 gp8 family phage protein
MPLRLLTAPTGLPVSLDEAKGHLRVESTDDDTLITGLLTAAVQHLDGKDGWLGRCLLPQQWALDIDHGWPCEIELPLLPVTAVDAVKYVDMDGSEQTLPTDYYDVHLDRGLVSWAYGVCLPAARCQRNAVSVEFSAGYADADSVPGPIKSAILLMVGNLYANREAVNVGNIVTDIPFGVDALLAPYRVRRTVA